MHIFTECLVFHWTDCGPNNPVPYGIMYKEFVIISSSLNGFRTTVLLPVSATPTGLTRWRGRKQRKISVTFADNQPKLSTKYESQ